MKRGGTLSLFPTIRGQAAMEYLMSYGWAIIVVLIAVGFLAYYGVLNVDTFLPSTCTLPTGFRCIDYSVESTQISLVVQNNLGFRTNVATLVVVQENGNSCSIPAPLSFEEGETKIITILGCDNGNAGVKFKGSVDISFAKQDQLAHTVHGQITGRVAGAAASQSSSSPICQDAEDNGLCDGLDLVYGAGYQAGCCTEYSLCC